MSIIESSKDPPPDARKYIEGSLKTAQMLWDDTKVSRTFRLIPDSSLMFIPINQGTIHETQESSEKAVVMSAFIDALTFLGTTRGFRRFMLDTISSHYNFGLPADFTFRAFDINLQFNKLGVFEPDRVYETEQSFLEGKLKSVSLRIMGTLGEAVSESQQTQMTAEQTATLMVSHLKDPASGQLLSAESIKRLYEDRLTGLSKVFQIGLISIKADVDWADEFLFAYEDLRFSKAANILRPVLGYLEPVT